MYKKLVVIFMVLIAFSVNATETITLGTVLPPSSGVFADQLKLINEANRIQKKYEFRVESHPGAQGLVGLSWMNSSPQNRISAIIPSFVELKLTNKINIDDYEPLFLYGEVCWAIISNVGDESIGIDSLSEYKGKELVVGPSGLGNSMHLTGIMLSEKYGFILRTVVFKSGYDALLEMTANNSVNLVLETVKNYEIMKTRNPRLKILGMNCPVRVKDYPNIKTIKEQGINVPPLYTAMVASSKMPVETRKDIESIFEQSVKNLGEDEAMKSSMISPTLRNQSSITRLKEVNEMFEKLQIKYRKQIETNQ
jgi:tripartite-type tricarboxylate transporter receptor subunit TctC